MMNEKKFDYESYIQRQLKNIDDLDQRRFARELLLEGLGKVFAWTESRYEALEQRVLQELEMPGEKFSVSMTVASKKDYDPINSFWFPVCPEDVAKKEQGEGRRIYLAASDQALGRFIRQGVVKGIWEEEGKELLFHIRKPERYREAMKRLYSLFVTNHVPWRTVHMGHLDRLFELTAEEEIPENARISFQWGEWKEMVREDMIPLWNLERQSISSHQYRMPILEEVIYEYTFFLTDEREEGDGYLMEAGEDILSIRYEENSVLIKTGRQTLQNVWAYRLHQEEPPGDTFGYGDPILSNRRKDHMAARYLHQTGNFLQTPAELARKVQELSGDYEIEVSGYEITDRAGLEKAGESVILGDMNEFSGIQVFSRDSRSVLLIRMEAKEGTQDFLCQSQARYILSQLQMEFMEYQCAGILL